MRPKILTLCGKKGKIVEILFNGAPRMKINFRLMLVLSMVFLNAAFVFGQEKLIEKKDYQEITTKAYANLKGKAYRTIYTYETFPDRNSSTTKSSKTITERVPPDRFRWIFESDGEKKEIIQIGPKRYIKLNNNEWKVDDGAGLGNGAGGGAQVESESYKLIATNSLNGQIVDVYEKTEKLKNFSAGDENRQEIWTTRYWIAKDGLLMKAEHEYETVSTKSLVREVTIYEYDPNIKIEAPVKP